jgi:hypothetical protein
MVETSEPHPTEWLFDGKPTEATVTDHAVFIVSDEGNIFVTEPPDNGAYVLETQAFPRWSKEGTTLANGTAIWLTDELMESAQEATWGEDSTDGQTKPALYVRHTQRY